MNHKRKVILTLSCLLSISFLLSACGKNYEKDSEQLLRLQANASEVESIKEEVVITEKAIVIETEETSAVTTTKATTVETTFETTVETTVENTVETTVETTAKPSEKPTTKPTTAETAKPTTPVDPSGHVAPSVNAVQSGTGVLVTWNQIDSADFNGYKVVASKSNPNPKYSEDGHFVFITDRTKTSVQIEPNKYEYGGGDIGGQFKPGETYYFSVTALYADHSVRVAGNAVQVTMPGTIEPTPEPVAYPVPSVSASYNGTTVVVSWSTISDARLDGYKVVMSSTNTNPAYPADGYEHWITDATVGSAAIEPTKLLSGTTYYFSVTALYDGHNIKIPGNAVAITIP